MKKKFIISDSVYFSNTQDEALFYNTENYKQVLIKKGHNRFIDQFCEDLNARDSLYVATFDYENSSEMQNLLAKLVNDGFGRVVPESVIDCAIPLVPIINNDLSFEKSREDIIANVNNRRISKYLLNVTIYVGGYCPCAPNDLYKQIYYPISSSQSLDSKDIEHFIVKCNTLNSACLFNIVLSNMDNIQLDTFISDMSTIKDRICFYALSTEQNFHKIKRVLTNGFRVVLIFDRQCNSKVFPYQKVDYNVIVRNESDLQILRSLSNDGINVSPSVIFDDNLEFLTKFVFLNEIDKLELKCSKRELFLHQKININYWGHIFITPDGSIYSSLFSFYRIGVISDSLTSIISNELIENYSWRQLRNNSTCINCVYQWLCPSPSPFEYFIEPKTTICNKTQSVIV